MKKIPLIISLIFLVQCVSGDYENAERVISLNTDNISEIDLNEITNKIEFLKLTTEDEVFIGDLTSVEITKNRIYTLDTFNSQGLYVFDRKGLPIFTIAELGEGPGEFTGPSAFAIDNSSDQIILYDAGSNKLIFFDKENLEFVNEERLNFFPETFSVTESNYLFYMNNIPNNYSSNILITDKNFNIIDTDLPINENMQGYHFYYPFNFTNNNDYIYFFAPSDYFIYNSDYDENTFSKYIEVDFGDQALPSSFFRKHSDNRSRLDEIGESAYNISSFFETDSFIFFAYKVGERTFHYYFESKKSGKVIHTEHSKLNASEMAGPLPWWPIAARNNTLIWHQQPMVLQNYLNTKKNSYSEEDWEAYKYRNRDLINFSQAITDEDNPYLIFMEIDF